MVAGDVYTAMTVIVTFLRFDLLVWDISSLFFQYINFEKNTLSILIGIQFYINKPQKCNYRGKIDYDEGNIKYIHL